jgi:hypothetical protein
VKRLTSLRFTLYFSDNSWRSLSISTFRVFRLLAARPRIHHRTVAEPVRFAGIRVFELLRKSLRKFHPRFGPPNIMLDARACRLRDKRLVKTGRVRTL